jgi:sensor histidine kinase YesM
MYQPIIHRPLFRILSPILSGFLIYLLVLLINNNLGQLTEAYAAQELYVTVGLAFMVLEANRWVGFKMGHWISTWSSTLQMAVPILLGLILGLGIVFVGLTIYYGQVVGFSISMVELSILAAMFAGLILLYHVLHFTQVYLHKENTQLLENERQLKEALEWELTEFSHEINPQLLYESLESLISLAHHSSDQAEEFIDYLAAAYRYTLQHRQNELVPLQEELKALHTVLYLLNERHAGLITFSGQIEGGGESIWLIPGTLPMLVEYIVRQSIISPSQPLEIRAYLEGDDYLILEHRLNERLVPMHQGSTSIIDRLQRAYGFFSECPLVQVKAYEENYIKLPLIRQLSTEKK